MSLKPLPVIIPCLVDQLYPEMGLAVFTLLEKLGFNPEYRSEAVCCGQPAYNSGETDSAQKVAQRFHSIYADASEIVCPSGSCTAMIRNFYPDLMPTAKSLAVRELSEFLADHNLASKIYGQFKGKVGWHNSCHSARELGITGKLTTLFPGITGYEEVTPGPEPVCCGFGGLFCAKFKEIAANITQSRLEMFTNVGAETVVSNDPGCILQLRTQNKQQGGNLRILHLAEFLTESMGIGA